MRASVYQIVHAGVLAWWLPEETEARQCLLQSDPAPMRTTRLAFGQMSCRSPDYGIVVDDDLNSTNAMAPDPNTLMAVKASDCTGDVLNNQALQRNSMRDES